MWWLMNRRCGGSWIGDVVAHEIADVVAHG